MRAESRTPAMPMTRSRGNPTSGDTPLAHGIERLDTGTMMPLGECFTASAVTAFMMPKLTLRRSSRLMPGLRGRPAVITTTSEFAVCA